ncbi:MAG: carboxypeptidase-like regulatory domain-containing protein [Planctomycetaceae bacterium]
MLPVEIRDNIFISEEDPEAENKTITGVAVDEAGTPLANAKIVIDIMRENVRRYSIYSGTSTSDGKFSIRFPAVFWGLDDTVRIMGVSEDKRLAAFESFKKSSLDEISDLKLVFEEPVTIRFVVLNEHGKAVPEATVGYTPPQALFADSTETDDEGNATLAIPASLPIIGTFAFKCEEGIGIRDLHADVGMEWAELFAQGNQRNESWEQFSSRKLRASNIDKDQKITTHGHSRLKIKVIDNDGKPVPDVIVFPSLLYYTRNDIVPEKTNILGIYLNENDVFRVKTDGTGLAQFCWLPAMPGASVSFDVYSPDFLIDDTAGTQNLVYDSSKVDTMPIKVIRIDESLKPVLKP